ncbi:nucleotide exchange factor GrpE [Candidatus Marinamargulisbacteria bacterium SCGC AG-343-K17]|nr:nucleotide exchange factor GrpE [Candidatus Marinamargulisbacteria bacterium SCGC AG-343-K17]
MAKKETKSKEKKSKSKSKKANDIDVQLNDFQDQVLSLTKENDELKKEMESLKDQSLRSLAELENVKRRKEQEKGDAIKFANERLIMELLPILDAFDLAMAQGDVAKNDEVSAVVSGFSMIQKQIQQFLEKSGVIRIQAIDQPFDPNLHQGISQESHPDKDVNTIVKEMQPGYTLNDRVIRPSMVVVSTK